MSKTHKDLEFAVSDPGSSESSEHYFKRFEEAAEKAVVISVIRGVKTYIDVLVSSKAAAKMWAGDDGVEAYEDDPDASVFERIEIRADSKGRVP